MGMGLRRVGSGTRTETGGYEGSAVGPWAMAPRLEGGKGFQRSLWLRCAEGVRRSAEFRQPLRRILRNALRRTWQRWARSSRPRAVWVVLEGRGPVRETAARRVSAPVLRLDIRSLDEVIRRAGWPEPVSSTVFRAERLGGCGLHTEGLYRLWWPGRPGSGPAGGAILKCLLARDVHVPTEIAAYTSRALSTLPDGVGAPRYLGHGRSEGGRWELWIEDLGRGMTRAPWQPRRYAVAARALGRLNATWLLGRAGEGEAWVQDGFLVAHARRWLATECWERRLRLGSPLLGRIRAALRALDAVLAAADAIPAALSHQDASPRNLLVQEDSIGVRVTLIDWELCGLAPLGQEIVPLVWDGWRGARSGDLVARESLVWRAYLEGLESGGFRLSPEGVDGLRLAYNLGAAALYLPGIAASGDADVVALAVERLERAVAVVRG